MPGEKRTPAQRRADEARIADLRLKCWTRAQICAETGLSESTVKRVYRKLDADWQAQALEATAVIKARKLRELDHLYREAYEQWERSKKQAQKKIAEHVKGGKDGNKETARVETTEQCGDPRYLTVMINIQERIARLLGLDAPQKISATDPTGDKEAAHYLVAIPPAAGTVEEWSRLWVPQLSSSTPH